MPDSEEPCHQEIACSLRALLESVDEILRLLRILLQENESRFESSTAEPCALENGITSLTDRESEIFRLLVTGMSNRQISRALGIAERTVKNNLHSVYRKFGVAGRAEVMAQYFGSSVRRHEPNS
ncbi:HTH-type transcriptional regulator MalT [Streptomyces griseofuscus]|uniref:HTH-type transcriptional regulator MalT n=1 Tax=Streptomyces griseofuscus TaxID=146922 RepID=A0A7H1PV86_9ACTN|nr:LuxR family transcriptional regulator [Streptomyces griseofuscus]QNT91966.1 HTH-type transcriptional regulator MalT [Streptomyces griseofuscus]